MTLQDASQVATIIGALAIIGIVFQSYLARKVLKADHERSRRERAVELLQDWSKNIEKEQTWARKLVEKLNSEQCRGLFAQQVFSVPIELKQHLEQFFEIKQEQTKNEIICLTEKQVVSLRWFVVSYLNLLESILVAWQYGIVSREIIEHEFSFLFSPEEGLSALQEFRTAAGGEKSFPAIELFANHLKQKRKQILIKKSEIA